MAQLAKIGATVDWRWSLKKGPQSSNKKSKEEDGDDKKGSKEGPRKSQEKVEKRTLLSASYQCNGLVFCITFNF